MEHVVLVGGGLASTYAAAQLRTSGFTGRVTMFSAEAERPYDHVPLSKDYLSGGPGYHELYLRDDDFYRDQQIDLQRNTAVTGLDPSARLVTLASGETVHYSAVLLATGADSRRLHIPGADTLTGVHTLRTLHDAQQLRADLQQPHRVAVIGAGFLGCEIAASAVMLGHDVTLISRGPLPLDVLGEQLATFYRDLHVDRGVRYIPNAQVMQLKGTDRVGQVVLDDATVVPAETVVIAVGAVPRTTLAAAAGLDIADGILTDASLATSESRVYAAGDVAAVWNPTAQRHERREHFNTARTQGKAAARSMLGEAVNYDVIPFFFTDQFDVWMEYTGDAGTGAELVIHGDVTARRFVAFWVYNGHLRAAMNVGLQGVPGVVRPLIRSGQPVDDHTLRRIVADALPATPAQRS